MRIYCYKCEWGDERKLEVVLLCVLLYKGHLEGVTKRLERLYEASAVLCVYLRVLWIKFLQR